MKNMIVKNIGSKSTHITLGYAYFAKVDSKGYFRVKDDSECWSKYSPKNFEIIEDPDNQLKHVCVTPEITTFEKEVSDSPKTFAEMAKMCEEDDTLTDDVIHTFSEELKDATEKALYSGISPAEHDYITKLMKSPVSSAPPVDHEFKKADVGDKIRVTNVTKRHDPEVHIGDIHTVVLVDEDSVETEMKNVFRDYNKEYEIIKEPSLESILGSTFKKAKVGDKIRITDSFKLHTPALVLGDIHTVVKVKPYSIVTDKSNTLRDDQKEYKIIEEHSVAGEEKIDVSSKSGMPTVKVEKEEEKTMKKSRTLRDILLEQGVPDSLITTMNNFRKQHSNNSAQENIKLRVPKPVELYEGGDLWTDCITAILAGRHILLSGGKATGKNTLTQSLAFAFQRPMWDISFHKNIGRDEIIGSETFREGNVIFNPGMAYMCALHGGFGVLDEINMANEGAIAVLNSILDDRRVIDVPGYDRLELDPATTFIGTMNYGYAGTRALNEALASRFVIPNVKELGVNDITKLLAKKYPNAKVDILKYFSGVFQDLQTKAHNAEISTASVDLRGIISALAMIEFGLSPNKALTSNVVNKSFEEFERKIVQDVINTRVPRAWNAETVFGTTKTIVVDMSEVK